MVGRVGGFLFEKGKDKLIEVIEKIEIKPILVGVYGHSNSGKSYLIEEVGDYFKKENFTVGCFSGAPHKNIFEVIRDNPASVRSLLLFHCAWERIRFENGRFASYYQDPECLSEEIVGRKLNLKVGIYNPNFNNGIKGEYEVVISNPDSRKKWGLE